MKRYKAYVAALALAAGVVACSEPQQSAPGPQITAQGFDISAAREGTVGRFGDIKVRIEAPQKIDQLKIKERSYEVDLANTTERSHFELFGLERRPALRTDVTLNFKDYINRKIDREGQYEIRIEVRDHDGRTAVAKLPLTVNGQESARGAEVEAVGLMPIEKKAFRLQRVGKGDVQGAGELGITWKTIDENKVAIKMVKATGGASKLVALPAIDFDAIATKEQMDWCVRRGQATDEIVLNTANNEAAGKTFAVIAQDKCYVLTVGRSETMLSDLGTTVTLTGEYKYSRGPFRSVTSQ
jgi:hypothetical protein